MLNKKIIIIVITGCAGMLGSCSAIAEQSGTAIITDLDIAFAEGLIVEREWL